MKRILFTLTLQLFSSYLLAQNNDFLKKEIDSLLKQYKYERKIGSNISIFDIRDKFRNQSIDVIENCLYPYEKSSNIDLQKDIFYWYMDFGRSEKDLFLRQRYINILLRGCNDSLKYRYGCHPFLGDLSYIKNNDYDENAKKTISNLINKKYSYNDFKYRRDSYPEKEIVLIGGLLEIEAIKGTLNKLIADSLKYRYKWDAKLALARMGDKKMITECINEIKNRIKKECQMDEEECYFNELKSISYIKQPEVLPIYEFLLFSDKFSAPLKETQIHGPAYAYSAIGLFERDIFNFPKIIDLPEKHEEKIKKAREWYKSNKDKIKFNRTVF